MLGGKGAGSQERMIGGGAEHGQFSIRGKRKVLGEEEKGYEGPTNLGWQGYGAGVIVVDQSFKKTSSVDVL